MTSGLVNAPQISFVGPPGSLGSRLTSASSAGSTNTHPQLRIQIAFDLRPVGCPLRDGIVLTMDTKVSFETGRRRVDEWKDELTAVLSDPDSYEVAEKRRRV